MWLRGRVVASGDDDGRTITVELVDIGREGRAAFVAPPREDDACYVARIPHGGEDVIEALYAQVTSLPLTDFLLFYRKLGGLLEGAVDPLEEAS